MTTGSRPTVDLLIRGGTIHTLADGTAPARSMAIGGGRISAVGAAPSELDHLTGAATCVLDAAGLTVLPAFVDAHGRLAEPARDLSGPNSRRRGDPVGALALATARAAALGLGTVRDALVTPAQLAVYQRARPGLAVRVHPVIEVPATGSVADRIRFIENLKPPGSRDERLRVWGLAFVLDPGDGPPRWDPAELSEVVAVAVRARWPVATHAVGPGAVGTVLDVYERIVTDRPGLIPGTLVVEHALLADAGQRGRTARLGVTVTASHHLLDTMVADLLRTTGPVRTAQAAPVAGWLTAGVPVAAGSAAATVVNPLYTIWGMVTRRTRAAGVQGPQWTVDRATAVRLHTIGGAQLSGGPPRGRLLPGYLADLVAYPADPFTVPLDDLPTLTPALTLVGGVATHDPGNLLPE